MASNIIKYIIIDPEILGGTPVISGTRIPVERVKELVKQGYTVDTLKKEYPQVSSKKIQNIISLLMERGLDDYKKTYKAQVAL
jgi:uncharacterized protein (DUF433 family)